MATPSPSNYVNAYTYWTGEVQLNPERIERDAVKVFTSGQCHALALALHEKTGWPLRGMYRESQTAEIDADTPAHTVVESPLGLVDIQGLGALERHRDWSNVISISKDDVLDFENRDYLEPNMEAANAFVNTVLKLYSEQQEKINAKAKASR